jgi:hypothetical protein
MDEWTLIHDAVYAVVPPVEISLPLFLVFVVLAITVVVEVRSLWRQR